MSKTVILVLLFSALSLAGCGNSAAPPVDPTVVRDSATPTPIEASPSPVAPLPTQPAPGGLVRTYRVVPEESEARFLVDEILAGSPKTVVGATGDVSGEVRGEFADPAGVVLGEFRVDLRSLRTDNSFRNRAIHDVILQTGVEANRHAVFQTTAIDGLPDRAEVGMTYPLGLTGDLTLHGVTRSLTFEAEVTPVSAERLQGRASVTIRYADFGVFILRLPPQVASVADVVTLEIDFVAVAE